MALLGVIASAAYFYDATEGEALQAQRDDSKRFERAEQALRAEPNVANVVYARERGSWNVELPPEATVAPGFAGYLCTVLAGEAMVEARTSVRTVDPVKLVESGFDYEAATIEHVNCRKVMEKLASKPSPG